MIRRQPESTRTDNLLPSARRVRSPRASAPKAGPPGAGGDRPCRTCGRRPSCVRRPRRMAQRPGRVGDLAAVEAQYVGATDAGNEVHVVGRDDHGCAELVWSVEQRSEERREGKEWGKTWES